MKIPDLHFLVAEDHEFQRKTLVIALKSLDYPNIKHYVGARGE